MNFLQSLFKPTGGECRFSVEHHIKAVTYSAQLQFMNHTHNKHSSGFNLYCHSGFTHKTRAYLPFGMCSGFTAAGCQSQVKVVL